MDEVTFSNVAPVISVLDLDRALRRYRKLGFSVRAYEGPERYGFAERDGADLHLSESAEHDRTWAARRSTSTCPTPTRSMQPGRPQG
jgi:hypothetical protein